MTAPSITCPRCGRTSWNPNDVRHGYCGACHAHTTADVELLRADVQARRREVETLLMQVPAELARGLALMRQTVRIYGPRGRGGRELTDLLDALDIVALTLDLALPEVMRHIDASGGGALG